MEVIFINRVVAPTAFYVTRFSQFRQRILFPVFSQFIYIEFAKDIYSIMWIRTWSTIVVIVLLSFPWVIVEKTFFTTHFCISYLFYTFSKHYGLEKHHSMPSGLSFFFLENQNNAIWRKKPDGRQMSFNKYLLHWILFFIQLLLVLRQHQKPDYNLIITKFKCM